jgi:threonine dehydratase
MNAIPQQNNPTTLPNLSQIVAARDQIAAHYPATAAIHWPLLSAACKAQVWVKHENHTQVGAFKGRGGMTFMQKLIRAQPDVAGVISATRGNHGQSLAYAASQFGKRAMILVPHGNSVEKNQAMKALGAELVEYGESFQEAREEAGRRAEAEGLAMVPPFHPDLVLGVATYWHEFFSQHGDLDAVLVPVGMGSGICSAVLVRDLMGLSTRVYGVVAEQAPAYLRSFQAKQVISQVSRTELADGLACSVPDEQALGIMLAGVEDFFAVSEAEIAASMRLYMQTTHNAAEGSAAAALAALRQQEAQFAQQKIGLPLTGGNVDSAILAQVLAAS